MALFIQCWNSYLQFCSFSWRNKKILELPFDYDLVVFIFLLSLVVFSISWSMIHRLRFTSDALEDIERHKKAGDK